ncbi:MAG: hypothetical protein JST09_03995 [Bacteroidetes bacterium]|nr:hypothetical protein [Bacteroidota bacterium]MBS1610813.1 hypothetical protein [Bacteroidota bacterium]
MKKLTRDEMKKIKGGLIKDYANITCTCFNGVSTPLCEEHTTTCTGVYAQCVSFCSTRGGVANYGTCEILYGCK